MRDRYDDDNRETDDRRTAALMGLAVVLSLAVAAVVLVRDLGKESKARRLFDVGANKLRPDRGLAAALTAIPMRRFAHRSATVAGMDTDHVNL